MDKQETMDGSPARIETEHISIKFQAGPIQENGVNGCGIEDVLDVAIERLTGFQKGPFACRENAIALTHLETARLWLLKRTATRKAKGVEGTNAAH